MFDFLSNPATHGLDGPVKRIDTHAAAVFLAGPDVYKVKKAVRFPFMDQSTLALRKHACEAEVAINLRFTPELYLGVVPITREGARHQLGGSGETVDWAVHLKRFDENQTLDLVADRGELTAEMIVKIAGLISESHRIAEVGDGRAATDALAGVVEETLTELLDAPELFTASEARRLAETMRSAFSGVQGLLLKRGEDNRVRRCHGDLHLRNIALLDQGPALFDAIEFSESIATTDVLYDLAFALMDLWKRDLRLEANLLLNRYLWRSENMTEELAGLAALPLFMSLRASVLAKVAAIRFRDVDRKPATRTEAIRYFAAARELLQPANPILVAVGGLSGSGKTALSTRIAPFVGRPPGAVHLRSDIERKRMLGAGELERLPAEGYAPDATARVFANLRTMAEATLDAGHGVVVDAVHRTPEERSLLRAVAEKTGARFVGLWLDAPLPVLVARVGARMGDASDATAEIVRAQAAEPVGTLDWERIDAAGPIDAVAAAARIIVARDA